jgi:hypothetical protein
MNPEQPHIGPQTQQQAESQEDAFAMLRTLNAQVESLAQMMQSMQQQQQRQPQPPSPPETQPPPPAQQLPSVLWGSYNELDETEQLLVVLERRKAIELQQPRPPDEARPGKVPSFSGTGGIGFRD